MAVVALEVDKFGYTYVFAGDPNGYGATCHEFGMQKSAGQFKEGRADGLAVREMTDSVSAGEFSHGERDGRVVHTEFLHCTKTFELCHRGRATSLVPFDAHSAEHTELEVSAMNARVSRVNPLSACSSCRVVRLTHSATGDRRGSGSSYPVK